MRSHPARSGAALAGALAALALSACAPSDRPGPGDRPAATPGDRPAGTDPEGAAGADPEAVGGAVGRRHGLVRRVDPAAGTVTVDVVQLFTGAAAGRACAEDGVPGHRGGLCDAYYLRDRSPRLHTLPVAAGAAVAVLGRGCATRPATLGQVAAGLDRHRLYRFDTAGGRVTALTATCPR